MLCAAVRMTLFRGAQKPFGRFARIVGYAGAGRVEAADDKLRFDIAKLCRSLIPPCRLAKIRLNTHCRG